MKLIRCAVLIAVAAAAAGCRSGSPGTSSDPRMIGLFGHSPKRLVAQMFESPDPDLRRQAIEELSDEGWGRRGAYLKAYALMTTDPAATVRSAACRALGRAGNPAHIEAVIAALKDEDQTVRWDAAVALDSLIDEQAIEPLSDAAGSDSAVDVRAAAAWALRHYRRREVLETLIGCLSDSHFRVRYRAAEALKELTGRDAGTDPGPWRELLTSATDPFAKPAAPKRPWWDLLGLTGPKPTASQPPAASETK